MRFAGVAVLSFVVALATWGFIAAPAHAHRGSSKHLLIEPTEDGARIRVEVEIVDAAVELGLGEDAGDAWIQGRDADIRAWLAAGIHLRNAEGLCSVRASEEATERLDDSDAARLGLTFVYRCSAARPLTLEDDTIFANDAQHEAFVRMRFGEGDDTSVLRRGRQTMALGAPASVPALLLRFVWEGVLHLITGYDHMLFLLALLLTVGEKAAKESRRAALKDVGLVITAFTLGHSVTLIAAAMGWVVLPSRLVETVIAASIVVVAIINIVKPESRGEMPWLALAFGLIHGFGFSGVLAELGLPTRARVLSLLSFNVGLELAQLGCVALALGPLGWLATKRGYRRWVVQGGSLVIALLAASWMIERALGLE